MKINLYVFVMVFVLGSVIFANSFAFEVSGEIIYEPGGLGVYVVALYEQVGLPEYITFTLLPGEYAFDNVDSGTYFALAFKDENMNLLPDVGEPIGFYQDSFFPILIVESDVDSVDIELNDSGATISGEVEVEDGNEEGQFIVLPLSEPDVRWLFIQGFPYVGEDTEYSVEVLTDGDYYVGGWRDSNMNYYRDESEPFGFYGGTDPFQITIEDLQDVDGIDFILFYPDSLSSVGKSSWGDIKATFGQP